MGVHSMLEQYLEALANASLDDAGAILHREYEEYYPQTGELIRGRDTALAAIEAYPGNPTGELVKFSGGEDVKTTVTRALPMGPPIISVHGGGDTFTAELLLDYPEYGRFHLVVIGRLEDGLVRSTRMYWAEPDEPAEWRAPFVEIVEGH